METDTIECDLGRELEGLRSEAEQLHQFSRAESWREAYLQLTNPDAGQRPIVVAMFGGTGVGKSELFNALIGVPNFSASSSNVRCCTKQPHIAGLDECRSSVTLPDGKWCEPSGAGWSSVVLIDTPDTNGILVRNHEVTRNVLDQCDLAIYVTDNDRYSDLAMITELRQWAPQKQWLFVLNKIDKLENDTERQTVQDDFKGVLGVCGFQDVRLFSVNATKPEEFDLRLLRGEFLQQRRPETVEQMRRINRIGFVAQALEKLPNDPLQTCIEKLPTDENKSNTDVRNAYRSALTQSHVKDSLNAAINERVWTTLTGRVWGPIVLVIWLRSRISWATGSMILGRTALRGVGISPLLGTALNVVFSAVRGTLALRFILDLFGPKFQKELETVRDNVRRQLEGYKMDHLVGIQVTAACRDATAMPSSNGWEIDLLGAKRGAALVGQGFEFAREQAQRIVAYISEDELLGTLRRDVEHIASKRVDQVVKPWLTWIANIPAVVVLGHIVWRLGVSWWDEQYLTLPFYGTAAAIFAASCLPGYIIFAWRVHRTGLAVERDRASELNAPHVTEPLRMVRTRLERFLKRVEQLRDRALEQQAAIREQTSELIGAGMTVSGS